VTTAKARPLPALTGARFVAAFVVVAYHLFRFDSWDASAVVERVVALGPCAVTFFFVLSGFVLSWASVDDEGRVASLRAYAFARLARLLPVHVLSLVVVFPVVVGLWRRSHGDGGGDFAMDVALPGALVAACVQAWHPDTALAWNPPAWSLSVEVAFYALFPWLSARLSRHPPRVVGVVALALAALSFVPGLVALAVAGARFDVGPAVHDPLVDLWRYHPLLRLPEFVSGVAAARFVRAGGVVTSRVAAAAGAFVVVLVVLVAAGVFPVVLVHNGLFAPAFAVAVARLASSTSTAARWLSSSPLSTLGEASYALYLLHVPTLYWITAVADRRGHARVLDDPRIAATAAVACVVVALVVHVAYERPARHALRALRAPRAR
jgi:peptidoglycan/LPS O-acetylase OafA/YrhL